MIKRKAFTLVELIVVIVIIAMLIAILRPARSEVKITAQRVVCGKNLKGLGTAMSVYANDYEDKYVKLGHGPWSKELGFDFKDANYTASDHVGPSTITSSLYLLIREADVSPKSFICPESEQLEYEGNDLKDLDIVEIWDFGPEPHQYVSYAYHNPYGQFSAGGWLPASFALMSDMSPWFKDGKILSANNDSKLPPQIIDLFIAETLVKGNSLNHSRYKKRSSYPQYAQGTFGFGQNVLFSDGHTAFLKQPNVGIDNDSIYTFWSTEDDPTEQDKQGGTGPTSRSPENDAKSKDDSFLAI